MKHIIPYFLVLLCSIVSCQLNRNTKNADYDVDIQSTAESLTLFGENLISTSLYERDLAINPQGNEIIFTLGDYKQSRRVLVILREINGIWRKPEVMNISGRYHDIEPFFANNGNRLFFASNRPINQDSTRNDYNIWYSDKIENIWTEPLALDTVVNTRGNEFFPSLSEKGNLFFTATRQNGIGREDIFVSEFKGGKFQSPIPLPKEINSTLFEFNAYISPKEDFIVFSSFGREDGFGGGDLYFSSKDETGNWSPSKNMGKLINSNKLDYSPFIDWKNHNFYFSSERIIENNTELKSIDGIKHIANDVMNGFGNIYKIGLDKIENMN
ncbi:TolB family protein [Lentiprolixibacter aurantiacus]|uniref:Exo-alpha-sialidase n=1 Tax=Lentiprolixibacter aurantiacus TaxID=2993939 RepID=A0AAE3MK94_9FLAO|nr:exo-alpha-sialidase [Lentiprolixibacter aurantiacus]MCX2719186.1 exo-alpha-sialidase [Lentiprolixibacter aurantiacus]